MIGHLFGVVLRSVAIPIVAIYLLQHTMLGEQGAWLAVIITLIIVNLISILFEIIRILPNALLLRGGRVIKIILSITIEIASVIGFIIAYNNRF